MFPLTKLSVKTVTTTCSCSHISWLVFKIRKTCFLLSSAFNMNVKFTILWCFSIYQCSRTALWHRDWWNNLFFCGTKWPWPSLLPDPSPPQAPCADKRKALSVTWTSNFGSLNQKNGRASAGTPKTMLVMRSVSLSLIQASSSATLSSHSPSTRRLNSGAWIRIV